MTAGQHERHAVEIARLEAEQHQETLQRTIALANRLMPATIVGALVLGLILGADLPVWPNWLCALLVVAVSLAGLTIHHTWLEFMELVRYKYIELYPRLFEVAGHREWLNYLEFTTPRSLRSWEPSLYLNAVIFMVTVVLWVSLLLMPAWAAGASLGPWVLCVVPGLCLLATIRTAYLVLVAARTLERDVKFAVGRRWDVGGVFRTALQLLPYGDGRRFMVHDTIEVQEDGADSHRIEAGFLTDLASVPRLLWPIFPPWERYGPAAVLHDHLYTLPEEECSRGDADRTFLRLMERLGVGRLQRSCVYLAVRVFGGRARRKAIGRPLLAPEEAERVRASFRRRNRHLIFER